MLKLKKIALVVSLIGVMTCSFIACGNKTKDEGNTSTNTSKVESKADKKETKDDYQITLGYYNCDHMVGACIGEAAGIFKELGLNVKITGNGKVPQAMAAGQMDVGYIGTRGLMASHAKGSPIMVAANNHIGGSMYLVVSNDIEKPEDLLGQPLAIGTKPERSEGWILGYTKDLNIPLEGKNYEALSMDSDQAAYLAMKTGKIKGYTCCDPWGSMAEYEGTGHIMSTYLEMGDKMGVCCAFSMNENFEKDHPELAKKMVLAHTKCIEYTYLHPIKAAKIFAEYYNVPEEVALMTIYKKTIGEGRTLTWKIDKDQFNHAMKMYDEHDLVENVPAYEEVIKTNLLKESGAKLFDEFIQNEVDPIFPQGMLYEEWKTKAQEIDKQ